MISNIPAGNILLSASILFSGALPSKMLRVLSTCGIQAISLSTFFRHQKQFLLRTISNVWQEEEDMLIKSLKNKELVLGGDGRNDSMGHSAKYGSYTLMEMDENKIINIQLVQVLSTIIYNLKNADKIIIDTLQNISHFFLPISIIVCFCLV